MNDRMEFVHQEPLGTSQSKLLSSRLEALHRECAMILNIDEATENVGRWFDDAAGDVVE